MGNSREYRSGIPTPEEAPYLARLGSELKSARGSASLRDIERITGISAGYLSRLERGLKRPRKETLSILSVALGLDLERLLELCGPALGPPYFDERQRERIEGERNRRRAATGKLGEKVER